MSNISGRVGCWSSKVVTLCPWSSPRRPGPCAPAAPVRQRASPHALRHSRVRVFRQQNQVPCGGFLYRGVEVHQHQTAPVWNSISICLEMCEPEFGATVCMWPRFSLLLSRAFCACEVGEAAFDISTGWQMTAECF